MVFRLSIKGVESTSMSMWVLAASKLSSVGRTGKLSGPAGKDRVKAIENHIPRLFLQQAQGGADGPFLTMAAQGAPQPPLAST